MAVFTNKYGGCACGREKCDDDCVSYRNREKQPATNYSRIVSKSPYELADWIAKILDHCENKLPDELCLQTCPLYKCCNDQPSDNIEDWLNAPAEEST